MPHRELFSWIHRISGALLVGLPPLVLLTHLATTGRTSTTSGKGGLDLRGLQVAALMPLSMVSKKVKLPKRASSTPARR